MSNPLATTIISESRTLWIGDVESWMDETYIASLFSNTGGVLSVKVIRDKNTGLPAGYGFVEFSSHELAAHILSLYNGVAIPGTNKNFRLNWGIFGGGTKTTLLPSAPVQQQKLAPVSAPDYSIYVGDLDPQVNDSNVLEFFQKRYKSILSAKVIVDPITKYSKGYGFVKFSNFEESQRAISEMQGALLRGRHIKTSQSFWKSASGETNYMSSAGAVGVGVGAVGMQPSQMPVTNANYSSNNNYYNGYYGQYNNQNYNYYEGMMPYAYQNQNDNAYSTAQANSYNSGYGYEYGYSQNQGYNNQSASYFNNYQQISANKNSPNSQVTGKNNNYNQYQYQNYDNYGNQTYNYDNYGNYYQNSGYEIPTSGIENNSISSKDNVIEFKKTVFQPQNDGFSVDPQISNKKSEIQKKLNNFEEDLEFIENQTSILNQKMTVDLQSLI